MKKVEMTAAALEFLRARAKSDNLALIGGESDAIKLVKRGIRDELQHTNNDLLDEALRALWSTPLRATKDHAGLFNILISRFGTSCVKLNVEALNDAGEKVAKTVFASETNCTLCKGVDAEHQCAHTTIECAHTTIARWVIGVIKDAVADLPITDAYIVDFNPNEWALIKAHKLSHCQVDHLRDFYEARNADWWKVVEYDEDYLDTDQYRAETETCFDDPTAGVW